ncbi:Nif3-like dinuclear metal center hexameric protein [Macrococcus brunensis]|uniref:Nif3-like dinuclear metal center hexameric protein n=1 Tax=Macrococcus brunensis TaxID=198483 RepID=UPI001EF0B530|nr:Nif3-like dinuclear metal center hexameric protein [Macrococcus brunensis]ULG71116.1 Nif3-like dinuclear metal center hexameric protein [Macrococcus brunensis]
MLIKELLKLIDAEIPFKKSESWDNVGLLIGDMSSEVTGILTTLDCTLEVVQEAVDKNCNTVIAHHPLIFSGIKRIENQGYGAVIHALIKNDLQLIAMHTNLDAYDQGVSAMIADKIGLTKQQILLPAEREMAKLQIFVPREDVESLKQALAQVGVGQIGDYSDCFFQLEGQGQFRPNASASPYIGTSNQLEVVEEMKLEVVEEMKLECVFEPHLQKKVEETIHSAHPYEEPAYDIYRFQATDQFGTGIRGELASSVSVIEWLTSVKEQLNIETLRLIGDSSKMIRTVGIISGAGVSYMKEVAATGVDLFLTGDIKYHEAHDLLMAGLLTADIEHYSEQVMIEGLKELLQSFDSKLNVHASEQSTNPFKAI